MLKFQGLEYEEDTLEGFTETQLCNLAGNACLDCAVAAVNTVFVG